MVYMGTPPKTMTTREFSELTGLAPAEVADLVREGKLRARKQGGKWVIPQSQLSSKWVKTKPKPAVGRRAGPAAKARAPQPRRKAPGPRPQAPLAPAPAETPPAPPAEPVEATYSISEFSAMTYLTEKGVAEWLKIGRLKGVQAESGEWRVLGRNLQVPDIARLVRK
jgi:excisionase family DNA binding protein